MNTGRIQEDARERIAEELEIYTAAFIAHTEAKISTEVFVLYLSDFLSQVLSLSGTTEVACEKCGGNGLNKERYLRGECKKCNGTGVTKHNWSNEIVLEDGELPEPDGNACGQYLSGFCDGARDTLNANYKQVVE